MSEQDYRVEQDSMGEVRVPANAKWRAQTQRAVENFPISGVRIERQLIGALASIKGCSAALRGELGMLDPAKAKAIHDAAIELAATGTSTSRSTSSRRVRARART